MSDDAEFAARLAEEREFAARYRREQARQLRQVKQVVENLVGAVAVPSRPTLTVVKPVAQTTPKRWTLRITRRDRGMLKTVIASCDGKPAWAFDVERYRDGYIREIHAERV